MPVPPSHTGPVTLADWTRTPAPTILRKSPLTVEGNFVGAGGGWRGTIDYRVPIKDIYDFCQFAGGNPYTVTVGGGTAVRYIPLSHPDAPALICTGINATARGGFTAPVALTVPPTGPTVATSNWSDAQISLTFTSVPFLVDGSTPFMDTDRQGSSEEVTIPGVRYTFPSDGTKVPADVSVKVATVVYATTIYLAFSVNDSVLNPLMGSVSSDVVLGQPAGTMRFDTYSSKTQMTAGGQTAYTLTVLMSFRSVEWNKILRADGVWEAPTNPAGGNIYAANALSGIFS